MKRIDRLASARLPDGRELVLFRRDRDYSIRLGGDELMSSRQHESELELARLGCAHLVGRESPRKSPRKSPLVLIGGLGLGYSLRQTLDLLGPGARVVLAELVPAVIEWNRQFLGDLNGHCLCDSRVEIRIGDVAESIRGVRLAYDAILLDVDNGPRALTASGNRWLYNSDGVSACWMALKERGSLALWSSGPDLIFERVLADGCFRVQRHRVAAHAGSRSLNRVVWVASKEVGNA